MEQLKAIWGRNITVKFYLNTKIKPISIGEKKNLYPLYVSIICKKQVLHFKYFGSDLQPAFFSQKEYDVQDLNASVKKPFSSIKDGRIVLQLKRDREPLYGVTDDGDIVFLNHFRKRVIFLLELFDVFGRDEFKIKNFVDILRNYYDLTDTALKIMARALTKEMIKQGYESLIPIIDWRGQHPSSIEYCLNQLQEKFELYPTKIDFEMLPFIHIDEALEQIKKHWKTTGVKESMADVIISKFKPSAVEEFKELTTNAVVKAVEFYKKGLKLTS